MKVLISLNSFKGSIPAVSASKIIADVLKKRFKIKPVIAPVSDGGDGLIDALKNKFSGKTITQKVKNPLNHTINSHYCVLKDKSAVIETAKASGLCVVKALKPMEASSYGSGELILSALKRGSKKIYVGLGGSATNDAGMGMAKALGVEFLDKNGKDIGLGVKSLLKLEKIDVSKLDAKVKVARFFAVTDVHNPLLGKLGSANVYGPQKGATPAQVKTMNKALANFSKAVKRDLGLDIGHVAGGAAAGGIAAGMLAFLNAKIVPGSEFILDILGVEKLIEQNDLIITGEGCLDTQTFYGKAPGEISRLAKKKEKPVLFVTGQNHIHSSKVLKRNGITKVISLCELGLTPKECVENAHKYLKVLIDKGFESFIDTF
jgi:glycerate 2-kinase